jgi:LuxR family maltose regulon positive regulatory protein
MGPAEGSDAVAGRVARPGAGGVVSRPGLFEPASPPAAAQPPLEPLSQTEIRVLRYLPTNLSAPEIASELYVSPNTVKTHMHHLYVKLGTHRRAEAVTRARALGLLAPSPHRR